MVPVAAQQVEQALQDPVEEGALQVVPILEAAGELQLVEEDPVHRPDRLLRLPRARKERPDLLRHAVAILLKSEFLVVFIGGVFVAETLSVMIQRTVFKLRRKRHGLEYAQQHRVFRRAPLHHHFELKGWPETQVVVRFWIIGILCAFVALTTLKLR